MDDLAVGFKKYIPGAGTTAADSSAAAVVAESSKLVKFRGTVIDIEKLVEKLDK
jgi:hypothetical protein